ncbi:benzoate transporter [Streptomyces sp. SID3343]|nr:benzoate transporter [Streptomyces sp. SID3343]
MAAGLIVSGCTSSGGSSPEKRFPDPLVAPAGDVMRLAAFDSCDTLLDDFRKAALRDERATPPNQGQDQPKSARVPNEAGAPAPQAPNALAPEQADSGSASDSGAAAPDHSTTNTQEKGVDEPDLVKTDGRRVVTVAGGNLSVVDVATHKVTGTLAVPGAAAGELLLAGDRALLIVPEGGYLADGPTTRGSSAKSLPPSGGGRARMMLVDLTGTPRTLGELTVDGAYVDARQVGNTARIVVKSTPRRPQGTSGTTQERIRRSTIGDWLPQFTLAAPGRNESGTLTDCAKVSRPLTDPGEPGHTARTTVSVLSFDLARDLGKGDPVTVAADVDTVYASEANLYLATTYSKRAQAAGNDAKVIGGGPPTARTALHQFDISGSATPRLVATGDVRGGLLNQYSMSEYAGSLRVATTSTNAGGSTPGRVPAPSGSGAGTDVAPPGDFAPRAATESAVTVLRRTGSDLLPVGQVGGLGRNERIYAVRFTGPIAYVVTFRQTDPLYTLDLSDPAKPRAVGELKINGYSAYLHPIANGRLIGVGQDATSSGQRLGSQVSLFDVSTLANPNRVAQYQVPQATSEAEFDPHAFLYWDKEGILVLPVTERNTASRPDLSQGEDGAYANPSYALVLRVDGSTITLIGQVSHPGTQIRRSMVIGTQLWTVSTAGIEVNRLADVDQVAWIPLG